MNLPPLFAALVPKALSPFAFGNGRRKEKEIMKHVPESESTRACIQEIRFSMQRLSTKREEHSRLQAELGRVRVEAAMVTEALRDARNRLSAREQEYAASNSALPIQPFAEESEILVSERNLRIANARVRHHSEKVANHAAEVEGLVGELEAEWTRFGTELGRLLSGLYCEQAAALRETYCALMAWMRPFGQLASGPTRPVGIPVFMFVRANITDPVKGTPILDDLFYRRDDSWRPIAGDFETSLQTLRAEIDAARSQTAELGVKPELGARSTQREAVGAGGASVATGQELDHRAESDRDDVTGL